MIIQSKGGQKDVVMPLILDIRNEGISEISFQRNSFG